jgi:coenzyme F420-reducing hydrogenase beta subunit
MSKRLEAEVWSLDNCAGCGLCVAACSKQVLQWNGGDHPVLGTRLKTSDIRKGPWTAARFARSSARRFVRGLERWLPLEGKSTLSAQARGPIRSGAPNDVIRAILAAGRSSGMLDGVVMLDLDPWDLKPVSKVAGTVEEIVDNIGPQYLWSPIFDSLNEAVFERGCAISLFSALPVQPRPYAN